MCPNILPKDHHLIGILKDFQATWKNYTVYCIGASNMTSSKLTQKLTSKNLNSLNEVSNISFFLHLNVNKVDQLP